MSACKALAIGLFIAVLIKLQDRISVERNPMGAVIYAASAREPNEWGPSVLAGQGSPKLPYPTKRLLPPKVE